MKTIQQLYKEIEFDIQQEREITNKGLINKAKKIKQNSIKTYLENSNRLQLIDILQLKDYLKIMSSLRPKDKIKLKQVKLNAI